jgi:hypothetical protein
MLNPTLYKTPVLLDPERHRSLRLRKDVKSIRCAQSVNVVFITSTEFEPACREYPILFVSAGENAQGQPQVAPVAVMGFEPGENLYLKLASNGKVQWRAQYVPAFLDLYPFTLTQVDQQRWGVCIDEAWEGWSTSKGVPLFSAGGEPTTLLTEMRASLEALERDIEQTRVLGERIMQLGLLQERRFTASMPDGSSFAMEGFFSIDEQRLAELSPMELTDLQRTGCLHLLSLHKASLVGLQELAERRWHSSKHEA